VRIGICRDREQFSTVIQPVEDALRARGHELLIDHKRSRAGTFDAYIFINYQGCSDQVKGVRFWLAHGISCFKPWWIARFADVHLAWGPYMARRLAEKMAEKKVSVRCPMTGWSKTDELVRLAGQRALLRPQVCRYFELDPAKPILAWMPTYHCAAKPERDYRLEDVLPRLRASSRFQTVLTGHDLDLPNLPPEWRGKLQKNAVMQMQLLTAADCVLTDSSSIACESLAVDQRPVVQMDDLAVPFYRHCERRADQPEPDFSDWARPETVVETVERVLAQPLERQARRIYWRDQMLGPTDGRCVERIVAEIERAAK